jgi:hypothetical protein
MGDDENTYRTSAVHAEPVGRMGRRRFVKTLSSLGFGSLAASLLTAEDVEAAARDEVPVVYGLTREADGSGLTPRRKTVPADWYDDFRSALAAHRNLEMIHHDGVASSAVVPGEYGGRNAAIHVEVTAEEARGAVPESVEDTPVEVRTVEPSGERELADDDPPRSPALDGEGVPGSVAIASQKLFGTLAPAMRHPADGSLLFATANHLFDGADNRGEPLFLLGGEKRQIGSVRASHPKSDLVAVRPSAGFDPLHRIRRGDPGRVLGQFTKAGLADLKARGEPLEKVGVTTGHTEGKIQAVDGLTCAYGAICKRGQLKWGEESKFADGDSGSVSYHADPDDPDAGVLVAGLNNARTWWPGEDYIWGTAAHHVTAKHGYTF